MANMNTNNYGFQPYQVTQYFPQPQGSIYMINSSSEVANVPVGAGLSAAICLKEGLVYLKTIQNGSPMLLGYKLSPLENTQPQSQSESQGGQPLEQRIIKLLEDFDERLKKLEQPAAKGGTDKWQL